MSQYNTETVRLHERIPHKDGFDRISFTEPPYEDVIFHFTKVELTEENDSAKLSYTYYIDQGIINDKVSFEKYIGDFLIELIEQGVLNNSLIYSGGVDGE